MTESTAADAASELTPPVDVAAWLSDHPLVADVSEAVR